MGPSFCRDAFSNGNLVVLEDPEAARDTIRAVLAHQLPVGFVADYAHWDVPQNNERNFCILDRSQPPVAAMSVWKTHQHQPDKGFLAEVYPKLVRWPQWWPRARDGNGRLKRGSDMGRHDLARLGTGWDDTPYFDGTPMSGPHMAVDAVDLNALRSTDAYYLSKIAAVLGKADEARQLHEAHNRRINGLLWNESMGGSCPPYLSTIPNGASRPSGRATSGHPPTGSSGRA